MTDLYKLLELAESSLSDYYAGEQYSKYDKEILEAVRKALAEKPAPVALPPSKDWPGATFVEGYGYVHTAAVRAIERAHGIEATGQEVQPAAGRTPAST